MTDPAAPLAITEAELQALIELEREREGATPPTYEETWEAMGWAPQPRQQTALTFLKAVDPATQGSYFSLVYGGAASGGKSSLLRAFLIAYCRRFANVRVLLIRKSLPRVRDNHEMPLLEACYPQWGKYNRQDHVFTFHNGSVLQLGYCEQDNDVLRFQGIPELEVLAFDEGSEMSAYSIIYLTSRIRSAKVGVPRFLLICTNPGGLSHSFLKSTFVKASEPEQIFTAHIGLEERAKASVPAVFVPAKVEDNQILLKNNPGYKDQLDALPENDRRALRDGDWDVYQGMFFESWRYDKHVLPPFAIPEHWRKWGGLDWGYAAPIAYLVAAQDPDTKRIYVIRELYQKGLQDSEAIHRITASAGGYALDSIYADPSMWQKRGHDDAISTADAYLQGGLPLVPGNNNRMIGWRHLRDLLADGPDGKPMLQVFSNCLNLIRTLPEQVYDTNRVEDLFSDGEDHACFVAGTMVATEYGERPIESIEPGDRVWTREGLRRVLVSGMTGEDRPVVRLHTSEGRTLVGTPEHPVWCDGAFRRLDDLRYRGILTGWDGTQPLSPNWLCSTGSSSVDTPTRLTGARRDTSNPASPTPSEGSNNSTLKYGSSTMDLSPRGMRSTTLIATNSIMIRPTSRLCLPQSIVGGTPTGSQQSTGPHSWGAYTLLAPRLRTGTSLQRDWPGTKSTPPGTSWARSTPRWSTPVPSAARRSWTEPGGRTRTTSATPIARRPSAERAASTTYSERVSYADQSSRAASPRRPSAAPLYVEAVTRETYVADVYGLSVEDCHEFYANGILVSNCDALRYLAISRSTVRVLHQRPKRQVSAHEMRSGRVITAQERFMSGGRR